jgi:hypothetical protein
MSIILSRIALGFTALLIMFGIVLMPEPVNATSYIFDPHSPKELIGSSHNVFVGIVRKQTGTADRGMGKEPQFGVEVAYNIKGNLSGTITLNQAPGSSPVQIGNSYLFSTRSPADGGWYSISSPWSSHLLSTDANITIIELANLAKADAKVREFLKAYPDEVPSRADTYHGTARNSFESLTTEQKQTVYDAIEGKSSPEPESIKVVAQAQLNATQQEVSTWLGVIREKLNILKLMLLELW